MIKIEVQMVITNVEECKSSNGKEYKKVRMAGSTGNILTCIFPEDKVYHEIKENERRRVTIVSRIYNGKEKVFINIRNVISPDEPCPFGEIEGSLE